MRRFSGYLGGHIMPWLWTLDAVVVDVSSELGCLVGGRCWFMMFVRLSK